MQRMSESHETTLPNDRDALLAEVESLKKQIYQRQMELDILNEAVYLIKKDQGIAPRKLANKEKARLIDVLRTKYSLNELLMMMSMPKSSYFYQREAQLRPDKYTSLRTEMKEIFAKNKSRYGYRRLHGVIKSEGITVSEKVVRRIMGEEELVVCYKKKRKYSSYKGEISPAVDNIVAQDFHIPAGKVYLSPIIDCFDGLTVSWTIGTSPDAELVNTMLDGAIGTLADDEHPIVHTDRGCHYRWPGRISRIENAGLIRSMSQKGCSPDNSACEGFIGRIKNEMFYNRSWKHVTIDQFVDELDGYLRWYNEERIKMSLGAMSPITYRRSIGLAV